MESGKDFGSPFDIFKAKLNKETVKSLKQPTGGMTGKRSKYSASPSVKLKKETIKKLAGNKTQAQKAKTKADKAKATNKPKSAPAAKNKSKATRASGSERFKPTKTNMGPNMAKVNKPDPKPAAKKAKVNKPKANSTRKGPSGPMMTSIGRPSTGPKPRNKDPKVDLKKRGPSRPSMTGFKKGGKIDGCATRGLTRAKRSR